MKALKVMETIIILMLFLHPAYSSTYSGLIVVTVSDLKPIVEEVAGNITVESILPPGTDPHHFSLSGRDVEILKKAELIILANSNLLSFERKIKEQFPGKTLDFEDYDVRLMDFPGYRENPHGYWLNPENAVAIAKAVTEVLAEKHPEMKEEIRLRFEIFREKVESAVKEAREIVKDVKGEQFVAMVPGVCYIASTLNLKVAAVMLSEGSGFVSGSELENIKEKLRSGEYRGIIVPEFMRNAKGGEIAEQICRDAGCSVAYVKFSMGDDYAVTLISNAARIAYARTPEGNSSPLLLYFLAALCMVESAIFFVWRAKL